MSDMEHKLNEHQLRILAEGILAKGSVSLELIYRLYASDESAKAALMSLEAWGYIVPSVNNGYVRVLKVPIEAEIMAHKMKEARDAAEKQRDTLVEGHAEIDEEDE